MDSSQPDSGQTNSRVLLEFISDFIMLLGIAMLAWHALHVAGIMPPAPQFLFRPWNPDANGGALLVYMLTAVSVFEYPFMLLLVSGRYREREGKPPMTATEKLAIRYIYATSAWIFILVLYFVQK